MKLFLKNPGQTRVWSPTLILFSVEAFRVSFLTYLLLVILEALQTGFVTFWLNPDWVLVVVFVSGASSLFFAPRVEAGSHRPRTFRLFEKILIALFVGVFMYVVFRLSQAVIGLAPFMGVLAGVLVLLILWQIRKSDVTIKDE